MLGRLLSLAGDGWRRVRDAAAGEGEPPADEPGATELTRGAPEPPADLEVPPEELDSKADILVETGLTPHEYVVWTLEENGGRLRQQEIVDLTGWADATVSRMLDAMEEEGYVERVQIGQEKVVCLPGVVPDVADRQDSAGADGR